MFRVTSYNGMRAVEVHKFEDAVIVAETYAAEGNLPSKIEGLGSRWIKWLGNGPELREGPGHKTAPLADPVVAQIEAMREAAASLCRELRNNDDAPDEAIHAVRRIQYAAEDALAEWLRESK